MLSCNLEKLTCKRTQNIDVNQITMQEDVKMKKIVYFFTFVLLMFALVTNANALTVEQTLFINEMNWLSDNSAFYLINGDANGSTIDNQTSGGVPFDSTIVKGDRIRGMFEIATVEGVTSGITRYLGGGTGNNEWTGIYELEVDDITDDIFTMKASTSFQTEMETFLGVGNLDGIAVSFFQSPIIDYTRLSSDDIGINDPAPPSYTDAEELLIANATNGSAFWSLGFVTDDNFWKIDSTHPDIWDLKTGVAGTNTGTVNLALDLVHNPIGIPLDPIEYDTGKFADMMGSGNMNAIGGVGTPFDGFDDFNMTIQPIPEPATMFLLGSGLIGLVGYSRKKFKL